MPGMKITVDSAMRARDVSRPRPEHEAAAEQSTGGPSARPRPPQPGPSRSAPSRARLPEASGPPAASRAAASTSAPQATPLAPVSPPATFRAPASRGDTP